MLGLRAHIIHYKRKHSPEGKLPSRPRYTSTSYFRPWVYPSDDCKLTTCWKMNNGIAGTFYNQWGWRLDGWTNTAACLAGRRRVTRQLWFCTRRTGRPACFFHTKPVALTGAAQLRADGISSCCYMVNVPSNAHISTPFFQKTVFFSRIFFGKPPSKFLRYI
jgi:hypothetical protein